MPQLLLMYPTQKMMFLLLCQALLVCQAIAFMPPLPMPSTSSSLQSAQTTTALRMTDTQDIAQPKRNADRPELPEIPGDYNWDDKYNGDADWITTNVPGKVPMNEIDLARQVTALTAIEDKWRKERIQSEYEDSINVGWVPTAELANGRFAMFFLITGLLTEYWTGVSLPGQVEELLRISGVIGFDG
jgi:hypothetical protein